MIGGDIGRSDASDERFTRAFCTEDYIYLLKYTSITCVILTCVIALYICRTFRELYFIFSFKYLYVQRHFKRDINPVLCGCFVLYI